MCKRAGALAVCVIALTAGPARAGSVPFGFSDGSVVSSQVPGPVLAGTESLWGSGTSTEIDIHRAPPDGPARTVATLPVIGSSCTFVTDLAGSAQTTALLAQQCGTTSVLAGGAQLAPIEQTGDPNCAPVAVDVDADVVAVARINCATPLQLHDLASGAVTALPTAVGERPYALRLTDHYIAVAAESGASYPVTVLDRQTGNVVFEVDLASEPRLVADGTGNKGLALEDDGTVVVGATAAPVGAGRAGGQFVWAAPGAPILHDVPGTFTFQSRRSFGVAGHLIAAAREEKPLAIELDVIDFNGTVVDAVSPLQPATHPNGQTLAFDGRRLVFTTTDRAGDYVRNEAYPYRGPRYADEPAATRPPTVSLSTTIPARVQASRLTRLSGSASDPDGDLASVLISLQRLPCSELRASGRFARLGPGCTPKQWLTLAPRKHWSYRFKRRLAKGRYRLTVAVWDSAGHLTSVTRKFSVR